MKAVLRPEAYSGMTTTGVGALLHFLVDGLCACCLFLLADTMGWASLLGVLMTYNVLAFLTQPLTGMLADRMARRGALLQLSVVLLAWGVAAASFSMPMTSAVLLGVGNSLFHVWGGKEVAVATGNDPRALGVFVSTGAFGLAVGTMMHSWTVLYVLLGAVAVTAAGALLPTRSAEAPPSPGAVPPMRPWMVWGSVMALMAVVMVRSGLGEQFSAGMAAGGIPLIATGAVAMAGKALGGWTARWIGIVWTMLLVAASLFVLSHFPSCFASLSSLLLVNLTMAVTLYLANYVMPGREGLAFGLLAAALMPGYLLARLPADGVEVVPLLLSALLPTIVIELLVLWVLRERRADVLWSSVVVNCLTNVPLNLIVMYCGHHLTMIVAGEIAVVLAEALWYWYFVGRWRQALTLSVLCNGFSFVLGLLASQIRLLLITL